MAVADPTTMASYFELVLTGLEAVQFTQVTGLTSQVAVAETSIRTANNAIKQRTIATPDPIRLSCQHVLLSTDDLWTWISTTITSCAGPTAMKEGTLTVKTVADGTTVKTWNLNDVYITGVQFPPIGAGYEEAHLTADLQFLVGVCTPM